MYDSPSQDLSYSNKDKLFKYKDTANDKFFL